MSRTLLVLIALGIATGCGPRLLALRPPHFLPGDLPADETLLRRARARHDEAQALLAQPRTAATLSAAYEGFVHSCREGHAPACELLNARVGRGVIPIPRQAPRRTPEAHRARAGGWLELACRQLADGRIARCVAREDMGYGMAAVAKVELEAMKGTPSTFFGQPIEWEVVYGFQIDASGTPAEQLEWARAQVLATPNSGPAWHYFATLLQRYQPDHASLPEVLARALQLQPEHKRLLNELAWMHVQAGRYSEAYPLAVRLMRLEPGHSMYLDTFAAAAAGVGRCEQAVAAQRRALAALTHQRSTSTRDRSEFEGRLDDYTHRCTQR